jgi:hypothetical protein
MPVPAEMIAIRELHRPGYADDASFFESSLQNSIGDAAARLLFGEWLEERGDWRAEGYQWMAQRNKEPSQQSQTCDWWHENATSNRREIVLPDFVWTALDAPVTHNHENCKEFASRSAAEEALCRALQSLRPAS